MPAYFFRSEPGAAELRRLARRESGRVCQRVLMIANMLEGMEHEEAARLAGLSRQLIYSAEYGAMNELLAYLTENCCGRAASCVPACNPADAFATGESNEAAARARGC